MVKKIKIFFSPFSPNLNDAILFLFLQKWKMKTGKEKIHNFLSFHSFLHSKHALVFLVGKICKTYLFDKVSFSSISSRRSFTAAAATTGGGLFRGTSGGHTFWGRRPKTKHWWPTIRTKASPTKCSTKCLNDVCREISWNNCKCQVSSGRRTLIASKIWNHYHDFFGQPGLHRFGLLWRRLHFFLLDG